METGKAQILRFELIFRTARLGSQVSRIMCGTTSHENTSTNFTSVRCGFFDNTLLSHRDHFWLEVKIIKSANASGNDHEFLGLAMD
jgi:hypothetical protein